MKKNVIRLLALLLLVLFCLSACESVATPPDTDAPSNEDGENQTPDENEKPDGENPDQEEEKEPEKPQLLDPAQAQVLVENKKTDYVIVLDDKIPFDAKSIVNGFKNEFWMKTGADPKLKKDTDTPQDKEILIFAMDSRNEVTDAMKKLQAPGQRGYYIELVGDKIVVGCDDIRYLESALDLLMDAIRDCGNGTFGVQKGYVGKLDIPAPIKSAISKVKSFYTGENNYTVTVDNVTAKNYNDYCAALGRSLALHSSNQIGENRFATYYSDGVLGRMVVYTMYYPAEKTYKVTYGMLGYLPATSVRSSGGATVTPSIIQNSRAGSKNTAAGMSTLIQLTDGRFIIFDGGPNNGADVDALYNMLKEMTPNGATPVIAAWIFSHAHGDHMGLAPNFIEKYHGSVQLEMVGHNFPDFDSIRIVNEDPKAMKSNVTAFYAKLDKYYPKAEKWVCHTGEKLALPGCTVEVLYTPEDYGTHPELGAQSDGSITFPWGNHACSVFRLKVNNTVLTVLGDAEKTLCKWMADNYKTALKSDVLSLSHHGLNGGELSMYKYIDPDICLWPIDRDRMESDSCRQYDFNKYLLNLGGYGTRNREHYCADETKKIVC